MRSLFLTCMLLYVFTPLAVLILTGVQVKVLGSNIARWTLIVVALAWGVFTIMNPYLVTWVPDVFIANAQQPYTIVRASVVFAYICIALTAIIRKSQSFAHVSAALVVLIFLDLCWSHIGGRYVGP